ncbi:MAG: T9SS type A sorting domain-containing protein [Saprospiraceae bacterium]|nr:T9SS type A sorting domain-containing protein [Saprospiraceae bacterium]
MKTKYKIISGYSLIFAAWVLFGGNAANPPNAHTNAPFDEFCNQCHGGGAFNGTLEVSGIPDLVEAGQTYAATFTIKATQGTPARGGFQLVSVFGANNNNAGDLTENTNDVGTANTGNREYVEHSGAKNFNATQVSWNFNWIAPNGPDGATITMYYAGNLTNGNGSSSGDSPISGSKSFILQADSAPLVAGISNQINVSCNGGNNGSVTADASGGTPPYTYKWSTGATSSTIANLTAGSYNVTIMDANAMSSDATVNISQPALLGLATVASNGLCNGQNTGSATANPSGGTTPYRYTWSNGRTTKTTINLAAGMYNVTVTDANDCTTTGSIMIEEPTALNIVATATNESAPMAGDGTVSVSAMGSVGPYSYAWSTGATTVNVSNLAAGTYQVTVTDANQCTKVGMATVQGGSCSLAASINETPVLCFGDSSGLAEVITSNALNPITYEWSDGQSGPIASNLKVGMYDVTVADATGCETIVAVMIEQPNEILIDFSTTGVSCPDAMDGAILSTITGGVTPFSVQWNSGDIEASLSGINQGMYTITLIDANNCQKSASVEVMVTDTTSPLLVIQNATLYLDSMGFRAIPLDLPFAGVFDNCGVDSLWAAPNMMDCTQLGEQQVTFSAIDAAGNLTEKMSKVTVVDTIRPVFLSCVEDIEVDSGTVVLYDLPVASDNCGVDSFAMTEGLPSGSIFPAGETKVSYMAIDASGNYQCCSFLVQVSGTVSTIDEAFNAAIRIFPNPVSDKVNIQLPSNDDGPVDFILYHANGQQLLILKQEKLRYGTLEVNLSHIGPGIYFSKIIQDNKVAVRRIMKH